jgi:cytidine deaminase
MTEKFRPIDLEAVASRKEKPPRREISPEQKDRAHKEFKRRRNELILKALENHIEAASYRGLGVGASLIASNPNTENGFDIEGAHNFKPRRHTQHQWDKLCAENNVMSTAILDGADYIPGIVVVSHHKILGNEVEDKNHSEKTLHCCQNCRNLFRELIEQGIMSDGTEIIFVNDESVIYEDREDVHHFKGVADDPEEETVVPKIKLKKPLTEEDVADLPYEQDTMGEFLSLKAYKNDPPSKKGYTIPPYELA